MREGGFVVDEIPSRLTRAMLAAEPMTDPCPGDRRSGEAWLSHALIDQVPDLLFVKDVKSRFVLANEATARDVGQASPDALIGKTDLDFYDESRARRYLRLEHEIMFAGLAFVDVEELAWDSRGGQKWFSVTKLPLRNAQGEVVGLVGCCRDISERKRVDRLHEGQAAILERIAGPACLGEILDTLLRLVEAECPDIKASILLVEEPGPHVETTAAPTLDPRWMAMFEGAVIAEGAGSCGTAAFRRAPVIVTDVETDPLWRDWRDAIRPFGLRACWSWPILATDGTVLGTSAMYCGEARGPSAVESRLAAFCSHIAGIAIQRKKA